MDDSTSQIGLIGLVGITAALVLGLHQLGGIPGLAIDWSDPVGWLNASPTEDAVGAMLRSAGLGIGYWVLATTTLYVATGLRGKSRRPRWVAAVTLPGVRKIVDRALATALTASIMVAPLHPALAASEPPPPAPVVFDATDGIPVPHVGSSSTTSASDTSTANLEIPPPAVAVEPNLPQLPASVPVAAPSTMGAGIAAAESHTVRQGDNLWNIAAAHLATVLESDPAEDTIAQYWRQLIETNRDTLRSGDPNLIFPGELVILPQVDDGR